MVEFYKLGQQTYSYVDQGVNFAGGCIDKADSIIKGLTYKPVLALSGLSGLAGFVVKVFITGVNPLNCAIVTGVLTISGLATSKLLKDKIHNKNVRNVLSGLTASVITYGIAKYIAIPFAPVTCVAVATTAIALLIIHIKAIDYFDIRTFNQSNKGKMYPGASLNSNESDSTNYGGNGIEEPENFTGNYGNEYSNSPTVDENDDSKEWYSKQKNKK